MENCRDSDLPERAYCDAMKRAALLAAGLFTLAACSSGGEADPPPPLDTEAPTTTLEPAPTTEPPQTTTTSTSTTTVAEPTTLAETTSVPETTSATLEPIVPATDPPDSIDTDVMATVDAVVDEAFVDYSAAWSLLRAGFEDPTNSELRRSIADAHIVGSDADAMAELDRYITEGQVNLAPENEDQRVTLLRSVSAVEDEIAVFQACETFTSTIVNATTDEVTYEGVDSYLIEVDMRFDGDDWKIFQATTIEEFVGTSCE